MRTIVITLALLMAGLSAGAQDDMYGIGQPANAKQAKGDSIDIKLTISGAYEQQRVVSVDSTSAAVLYDRAMMAITDLTGSDGKAKAGIDYQNQETHTVVYKGRFGLPFGDGVDYWADFTMKVRCKDGRVQVTMTVPMVEMRASAIRMERSATVGEIKKATEQAKGKRRKRGEECLNYIKNSVDAYVMIMETRLTFGSDEDF